MEIQGAMQLCYFYRYLKMCGNSHLKRPPHIVLLLLKYNIFRSVELLDVQELSFQYQSEV